MTWLKRAACRGLPAHWWYPPSPITTEATVNLRKAKQLCAGCEVRVECLEAGMTEEYGVWGGLSPKHRRKLRKEAS